MDFCYLTKYLNDFKKEEIVNIGNSLGLDYVKLCNLTTNHSREMILWWLEKRDNVMEISGTPTLKSLIDSLEQNGHIGHANKIKECNTISTSKIGKFK